MRRHGLVLATAMAGLFLALLLFLGLIGLAARAAGGMGAPWPAVADIGLIGIQIAYFVALFLFLPQAFLLRRMGARRRWIYVLSGIFSGWLFLLSYLLGSGWIAALGAGAPPMQLLRGVLHTADAADIFCSAAFGALFGWLWSMPIYRLPGDNRRDWQTPMQANNPVDFF